MAARTYRAEDEIETLDLSKWRDSGWLKQTFGDVTKASAAKQISIGGVSGWVSGYIAAKIGKAAAMATGGSLLLLQIAHYKGYIKVDWKALEKDFRAAQRTVDTKKAEKEIKLQLTEVQRFARENMFLAGGFACGFLIGLAS